MVNEFSSLRQRHRILPAVTAASENTKHLLQNTGRKLLQARHEHLAAVDVPASVLLLLTAIALPIFTFAVAYRISSQVYAKMPPEERWPKGYFLSAALDLHPASNFGAFFLTMSLVSATGVSLVRHMIVARRLPAGSESLHRCSLALAFASSLGGNGVTAFPHHDSRVVHNAMAITFFLGNLLHFTCEALLEWREPLGVRAGQRAARFWHGVILTLAATCTLIFLVHVLGEEMGGHDLRIGKLTAAVAEITTVGCFLIYIGTYYRSFAATRLHLSISLDGERSDPEVNSIRKERSWTELRKEISWTKLHSPRQSNERRNSCADSIVHADSNDSLLDLFIDTCETIAVETIAPFLQPSSHSADVDYDGSSVGRNDACNPNGGEGSSDNCGDSDGGSGNIQKCS